MAESYAASLMLDHGVCWLLLYTCELLKFSTDSAHVVTNALCFCLALDVAYVHMLAAPSREHSVQEDAWFTTQGAVLRRVTLVAVHALTLGLVGRWLSKSKKGIERGGDLDRQWSVLVPGLVGLAWATVVDVLVDSPVVFGPVYVMVAAPAASSLELSSNRLCLAFISLIPFGASLLGLAPSFFVPRDFVRSGAEILSLCGALASMFLTTGLNPRKQRFATEVVTIVMKGTAACGFVLGALRRESIVFDHTIACVAAVLGCAVPNRIAARTVLWTAAVALSWQAVGGQWTLVGVNIVAFVSVVVNAMGDQGFPEAVRAMSLPLLILYFRSSNRLIALDSASGRQIESSLDTKADVFVRLLALSIHLSVLAWMGTSRQMNIWSKSVHGYILTTILVIDAVWPPLPVVRYNLFIALVVIETTLCTIECTHMFLAAVVGRIVLLELGVNVDSGGMKKALFIMLLVFFVAAAAYARVRSVPRTPASRWLLQSAVVGICFAGGYSFAWFELSFLYVATLSPLFIATAFTAGLVNLPKELTLRLQSTVATNIIGAITLVFVTALLIESTDEAEVEDLASLRKGVVLLTGLFNAANALWLGTVTKHQVALQKRCASFTAVLSYGMIYLAYVLLYAADVHVLLLLSPLLYFAGFVLESRTARPFGIYLAGVSIAIIVQSLFKLFIQDIPYRQVLSLKHYVAVVYFRVRSRSRLAHNSLYVQSQNGYVYS